MYICLSYERCVSESKVCGMGNVSLSISNVCINCSVKVFFFNFRVKLTNSVCVVASALLLCCDFVGLICFVAALICFAVALNSFVVALNNVVIALNSFAVALVCFVNS